MSFMLEITGNEIVEKVLKELVKHRETLEKHGFDIDYYKLREKTYRFVCMTTTAGASLGLVFGGKKMIIKELEKKLKEADPNCSVKEVKVK